MASISSISTRRSICSTTPTQFVTDVTAAGGRILFVGTKKQAQEVVAREAQRAPASSIVNRRWLGGTLTNFVTIRSRLRTLKQLQQQSASRRIRAPSESGSRGKRQELERLERTLGGMRDMTALPGAIFVVDPKREHLASRKPAASRSRSSPSPTPTAIRTSIDFIIPGNDDAIRSVRLITAAIADAAIQGSMQAEIVESPSPKWTWAKPSRTPRAGNRGGRVRRGSGRG